jgi:parvulin-like peptidyl-prolyl isomerase
MAQVNGEKITAFDLLRELRGKKQPDTERLMKTLDMLILHTLLDKEAGERGYAKIPRVNAAIVKYRKKRLTEFFKRKVILPLIKVEEKEILQYYKTNPEEFMGPDKYRLRMIFVAKEEEASSIVSELLRGADFGYLAKAHSLDSTKNKQGNLGWVPTTRLSPDIASAAASGKVGKLIGPFKMEYGFSIMELLGKRPGELKPFDQVKADIDRKLGRKQFDATFKKYLGRLRETVSVEIDEKALRNVIIVRPKEG